jgi:DNA-binding XRE family transcriptional regulator
MIDEIDIAFSKLVYEKRKRRDDKSSFTGQVCAEHLDMSRKNFSRLENNKIKWKLSDAIKICQLLGITEIKIEKETKDSK